MVAKSVKQARFYQLHLWQALTFAWQMPAPTCSSLTTASSHPSHCPLARTRSQQSPALAHLSGAHDAAYNRAGIMYSQIVHVLTPGVTHQEAASQEDRNAFFSHSTTPAATPHQAAFKSHGAYYISIR